MDVRLDGKVAVVTGAAQGIGLAIAKELSDSGANVAVIDRQSQNVVDKVAKGLKGAAKGYQLDITDVPAIKATVNKIRKEMGEIDILVCCAGIDLGEPRFAVTVTEEEWDRVLDVNCKGTFFCMQTVAEQSMIPRKKGSIVTISSTVGLVGAPMCIPYATSKSAVWQMTRCTAIEWGQHNVRVNAVAPVWTDTEMTTTFFKKVPDLKPHEIAKIPLGRFASVEEVAQAVCFLASEQASLCTGAALPVDGGWTAP